MKKMNDDFYIGWAPQAPPASAKFIQKILLALAIIVVITAVTTSLLQKKFGTGNFEIGKLTTVKGIYFNDPVPLLKIPGEKDQHGNPSFITIPLIGYGKFGAEGAIADMQKQAGISLQHKEVTMKGTLLYNDGKLLMQVDANDSCLVSVGRDADSSSLQFAKDLGEHNIKGEIVDPKCFFGVMKPGEGKPHKDCAVRCILGGMPPVLKVNDEKGNENYYLLVGANGEKINDKVKDYVAEPVTIDARVVQIDDWIVLYVKEKGIERYSYIKEHYGDNLASCGIAFFK